MPQGRAIHVPPWVVESWEERKTQIYPAETYAVYAAIWTHAEQLAGLDVIAFVDNEAAASSIIRGRCDDVGDIVQSLHWLLLKYSIRLWVEWIDSKSNPSDGLSRLGLLDPWTLQQGWSLDEGSLPPWKATFRTHVEMCRDTLGLSV